MAHSGYAASSAEAQSIENLLALRSSSSGGELLRACETHLKLYPGSYAIWGMFGNVLFENGNLAAAAGAFSKILHEHPTNIPALTSLARCLSEQGRLDGAVELYRAALAVAPHDFSGIRFP